MFQIIGVIDEPVAPGSTDNLDLKIHSKSLIDFVQQTNTPITVVFYIDGLNLSNYDQYKE